MAEHLNEAPRLPRRAVVLGVGGFVGRHVRCRLEALDCDVLGIGSKDIDLLDAGSPGRLKETLRDGDALVVISAIAPCRTVAELVDNVAMMGHVCAGIEGVGLDHVVYISSDAVYEDEAAPVSERTPTTPQSLHGHMHVVREGMIAAATSAPLAILRPSLLYGADDPHNGYGPNRFRRLAAENQPIVLFGEGEERRDHVYVGDVGEIVSLVLQHRSRGVLNIATGKVYSFRAIAEMVVTLADHAVAIQGSPRSGPMPHGGHRPFDIADCLKAFPAFHYTDLRDGLALSQRNMKKMERA